MRVRSRNSIQLSVDLLNLAQHSVLLGLFNHFLLLSRFFLFLFLQLVFGSFLVLRHSASAANRATLDVGIHGLVSFEVLGHILVVIVILLGFAPISFSAVIRQKLSKPRDQRRYKHYHRQARIDGDHEHQIRDLLQHNSHSSHFRLVSITSLAHYRRVHLHNLGIRGIAFRRKLLEIFGDVVLLIVVLFAMRANPITRVSGKQVLNAVPNAFDIGRSDRLC
mmetsp:Transcript_27274/g.43154  ORF Transcript_27274/g.43154 Transcript_27274/m.43154 type:complete len:221 (-) Transcript_27274:1574-2236(-)